MLGRGWNFMAVRYSDIQILWRALMKRYKTVPWGAQMSSYAKAAGRGDLWDPRRAQQGNVSRH